MENLDRRKNRDKLFIMTIMTLERGISLDTTFHTDKGVFNYRTAAVWTHNEHILLHRQAEDSYWRFQAEEYDWQRIQKQA